MSRRYSGDIGSERFVSGADRYNMQLMISDLRGQVHERDHVIQEKNELIRQKDEEILWLRQENERIRRGHTRRDEPPPFTPITMDE
jgi:hypothetical protein